MINSAIALLMERGAAGVSVDAVLAHSGAPRGSVYHHFPGGRDELLLTAARTAADNVGRRLAAAPDGRAVLAGLVGFWRKVLTTSDFKATCPVIAMAVNPRDDLPAAHALVQETFANWRTQIATALGTPDDDDLATFILSTLEGAIVLCRAQRDTRPLDIAEARLSALLPR
ncbi:TetR/AcrR family transcriptional regulator [Actinokineospora sp. G85]|uniref:TetR/AcrR family transcriptional regulator n=1 Tax=Actinokineospora sp. G85 TaxID=3406626 RepID=UPI003C768A6E